MAVEQNSITTGNRGGGRRLTDGRVNTEKKFESLERRIEQHVDNNGRVLLVGNQIILTPEAEEELLNKEIETRGLIMDQWHRLQRKALVDRKIVKENLRLIRYDLKENLFDRLKVLYSSFEATRESFKSEISPMYWDTHRLGSAVSAKNYASTLECARKLGESLKEKQSQINAEAEKLKPLIKVNSLFEGFDRLVGLAVQVSKTEGDVANEVLYQLEREKDDVLELLTDEGVKSLLLDKKEFNMGAMDLVAMQTFFKRKKIINENGEINSTFKEHSRGILNEQNLRKLQDLAKRHNELNVRSAEISKLSSIESDILDLSCKIKYISTGLVSTSTLDEKEEMVSDFELFPASIDEAILLNNSLKKHGIKLGEDFLGQLLKNRGALDYATGLDYCQREIVYAKGNKLAVPNPFTRISTTKGPKVGIRPEGEVTGLRMAFNRPSEMLKNLGVNNKELEEIAKSNWKANGSSDISVISKQNPNVGEKFNADYGSGVVGSFDPNYRMFLSHKPEEQSKTDKVFKVLADEHEQTLEKIVSLAREKPNNTIVTSMFVTSRQNLLNVSGRRLALTFETKNGKINHIGVVLPISDGNFRNPDDIFVTFVSIANSLYKKGMLTEEFEKAYEVIRPYYKRGNLQTIYRGIREKLSDEVELSDKEKAFFDAFEYLRKSKLTDLINNTELKGINGNDSSCEQVVPALVQALAYDLGGRGREGSLISQNINEKGNLKEGTIRGIMEQCPKLFDRKYLQESEGGLSNQMVRLGGSLIALKDQIDSQALAIRLQSKSQDIIDRKDRFEIPPKIVDNGKKGVSATLKEMFQTKGAVREQQLQDLLVKDLVSYLKKSYNDIDFSGVIISLSLKNKNEGGRFINRSNEKKYNFSLHVSIPYEKYTKENKVNEAVKNILNDSQFQKNLQDFSSSRTGSARDNTSTREIIILSLIKTVKDLTLRGRIGNEGLQSDDKKTQSVQEIKVKKHNRPVVRGFINKILSRKGEGTREGMSKAKTRVAFDDVQPTIERGNVPW